MGSILKNILNSPATILSMFSLLCSIVTINVSIQLYHQWTGWVTFGSIIGSVVFIGWFIWASYNLIAKRSVKEMDPKVRRWFDLCNVSLLLYWSLVCIKPSLATHYMLSGPWMVFACFGGLYIYRNL